MKRTLYISHGDKGGVGKSYLSMLAVEHLLRFGHVSLVEADPTQPDLGVRYMGLDNVTVGALPLNKAGDAENALSAFGEMMETTNADLVVVNLPAGAGETLDSTADMIRDLSDALEYRLMVTYALEKNRVASDALIRSMATGLLSVVDTDKRFVAYPEYKGKVETFDWYNRPERKKSEIGELIVPSLGNRSALNKLEATRGCVADLVDKANRPDGWMILDQSSVYRWYQAGIAAIAPIFRGE
ncbi:MAG: P-loop NTPase family protein [Acidithiobacillus ferrivorans]